MKAMEDDASAGQSALGREALAAFLEERRAPLLAYIERQLGAALRRKVEPEDILQEVAAEALRSAASYSPAPGDLFGWLCQLAERRIIDAHRRFAARKRDASREVPLSGAGGDETRAGLINLLVASMTSPSQAFSRNQREQQLNAALLALPPEHRELLRLRFVERLPTKEIAQRLGKSDGAIRVLLTRLLRRLQQMLGPDAAP
jgi:RNA polymerase sigma-70 factor (ECF subfamily)